MKRPRQRARVRHSRGCVRCWLFYGGGVLVIRSYRYRIYPTAAQAERLRQWDGALRFLWNVAHEQREHAGRRARCDRRAPTAFDQINELTGLRAELPWLADVPRDVSAQVLVELDLAWQLYFKAVADRLLFKRKGRNASPVVAPQSFRVEGEGRAGRVVFPKLGALRAVLHRPLGGRAKRCALVREGDAWFASVVCEVELPDAHPSRKPPVAIDRGVALLLADSDGGALANPRHAEKLAARIARAQRVVARRQRGSKNQRKARDRVAALQRTVRRQRAHVLHVASKCYAKNHGVVVLEALKVRAMTASAAGTAEEPGVNVAQKRGLNRAIAGAGWGLFGQFVRYKVIPEGGRVLEVPPQFSSQTCSACGTVDAASRVSQALFVCTSCGHRENADVNAAKVLLARGLAVLAEEATATVCGGLANGRPTKQKLRVARRGTRPSVEAKAPTLGSG